MTELRAGQQGAAQASSNKQDSANRAFYMAFYTAHGHAWIPVPAEIAIPDSIAV
jgi:hypothetical protein